MHGYFRVAIAMKQRAFLKQRLTDNVCIGQISIMGKCERATFGPLQNGLQIGQVTRP